MSELLTVREVADILRVDVATICHWIRLGVLEAIVLPHGGKRQFYRIPRETVNTILASYHLSQSLPKVTEALDFAEAGPVTAPPD